MRKVKQGTDFKASLFLVDATDHVTPVSGKGALRESLDISTVTVNLDGVIQLKEPGDTAYTFSLINNATLAIITEDASSINIGYVPGVTTQTALYDFIEANATYIEVADRGANGATLIDNPDDHIAAEPLVGGADNTVANNMVSIWYRWNDGQWINGRTLINIGEASNRDTTDTAIGAPDGDYVAYVTGALTSGLTGELSIWAQAGNGGEAWAPLSDPAIIRVQVVAFDPDDAAALGLSRIDAAITSRLAPTEAGRALDVTAAGNAGIDWGNVQSPTTTLNLSGTTIKTATDVATAVAALPTAAQNADAVWDEQKAGHVVANSFGKILQDIDTSAVASATVAALMAYAHDTGVTFGGLLTRLEALVSGKATGLKGAIARFFRRDGTTVAMEVPQNVANGTRATGIVSGGTP